MKRAATPRKLFRKKAAPARFAFTLVETLMAIALLAGMLAAAVAILFQVANAWSAQADDPMIDRHAEGLDRFVRRVFVESGPTGLSTPTATQMSDEGSFLVVSPPADVPWVAPLALYGGAIQGRLALPKDSGGLWLYWNTARETTMGVTNPHKTLLSPWVVSASVFVYDTTALIWNEFTPGNTDPGVSTASGYRVIRIEIVHLGQRRVLEIPLPKTAS